MPTRTAVRRAMAWLRQRFTKSANCRVPVERLVALREVIDIAPSPITIPRTASTINNSIRENA